MILRRLWIIALVALVLTGSALGFSLLQEPVYEASVLLGVGQGTPDDPDAALGRDVVVDGEQLVATVARAVDTLPVAQGVVERLNLPEGYAGTILRKTDAVTEPGTAFVEVSYRDSDPERAQRIANAIGETFSVQVSELNVSATPITAQVWQPATLPATPVSPRPLLNVALALVIGTVLGTGLAFLLESLDYGGPPRKE